MVLCSCSSKSYNESVSKTEQNDFQKLIKKLSVLDVEFSYDLVKEDANNCYEPKGKDSLFYETFNPIVGVLKDTSGVFAVLHLEPGDDLYPVLRTFDRTGKLIDETTVSYGVCALGDCEFDSCGETLKITGARSIEDVLTYVTTFCDSLGNKIPNTTKSATKNKKQTLTIEATGQILVAEKVE